MGFEFALGVQRDASRGRDADVEAVELLLAGATESLGQTDGVHRRGKICESGHGGVACRDTA